MAAGSCGVVIGSYLPKLPARIACGPRAMRSLFNFAWASPSKIAGTGRVSRFLRVSTASSPSHTSCSRTRETMVSLVLSTSTI